MKPEDEEDVGQPRPLAVEPRHVLRVDEFRFGRHFMGDAMMTPAPAKWREGSFQQSKSSKLFVSTRKVIMIVLFSTIAIRLRLLNEPSRVQ